MIRIANRFSSIERNIHRYYQLRLCRSVLWAWLYATATSLGAARPGFHDIIRGCVAASRDQEAAVASPLALRSSCRVLVVL